MVQVAAAVTDVCSVMLQMENIDVEQSQASIQELEEKLIVSSKVLPLPYKITSGIP